MLDVFLKTGIYFLLVLAVVKPLGVYMKKVFSKEKTFLDPVLVPLERLLYRVGGVGPLEGAGLRRVRGRDADLQRRQPRRPLRDGAAAAPPAAEPRQDAGRPARPRLEHRRLVHDEHELAGLLGRVDDVALHADGGPRRPQLRLGGHRHRASRSPSCAASRGSSRRGSATSGSTSSASTLWVLLPISLVGAIVLMSQGVIQNFKATRETVTTLEGATQKIPQGPIASQEAIKELGTNGGGFFNANSAHPYENPTPFSEPPRDVPDLLDRRRADVHARLDDGQDAPRLGGLLVDGDPLPRRGADWPAASRCAGNPIHHGLGVSAAMGNMEGKEVRFGPVDSALFATITTDASCGAVNSMHDSFTPLGGLVPLLNIQLGEIIFGGVGAGLYGMLLFVVLSVFIAGLMVGRTPEYLGKKIEAHEVKLAMLSVLILTFSILVGTAARRRVEGRPREPEQRRGPTASPRSSTPSRAPPGTTAAPSPG